MIRDKKKIGLLAKKSLLIGEKKELEVKIQQLEIPNYRSPKILNLYSEQLKKQRKYAARIAEIENELGILKTEINIIPSDELEEFKKIIKQTFGREFFLLAIAEASSRSNGNEHNNVMYISESSKELTQYKSKCERLESVLQNARKELTNYIISKELEMNKMDYSEFIKKISKLNQSIPHHSKIKYI